MKKTIYSFLIMALLLAFVGPINTQAAYAYNVDFTTWITYQNVGTATTTTLSINLYDSPGDTTPQTVTQPNLAKDASTSVGVGSLTTGNFEGTAVMAADQPLAATLVQLPPSVAVEPYARNRPMSNGFANGTQNVLIASINKRTNAPQQITRFAVQNAGTSATTVTISFYGSSAVPVYTMPAQQIQAGAGYHVDVGTITQLANGFTGSAVVTTSGGSIVGSAMELDSVNVGSKAFEGVGAGATTVYMPSALCNYVAGTGNIQNSYYAFQNTSATTAANITVTFDNGHTVTRNNVPPYTKANVTGCEGGNPNNYTGSAVVTSTQPIIGLGKINSNNGLTTAFIGATAGATKIAVPYVRWPQDFRFFAGTMQRTNLAIQNIGGATITGNITVTYINPDGSIAGTHTITDDVTVGGKVNSNPTNAGLTEFGCQSSCTVFGGGAIVQGPAGSQLAVLARVINYVPANGQRVGEDLSGIPYP